MTHMDRYGTGAGWRHNMLLDLDMDMGRKSVIVSAIRNSPSGTAIYVRNQEELEVAQRAADSFGKRMDIVVDKPSSSERGVGVDGG